MQSTSVAKRWQVPFFAIWTGQAFSMIGSRLVQFALVWWLTRETGSGTILATATLVAVLPSIVLGPFAGALVDRWNRRRMLLAAQSLAMVQSFLLAFLALSGEIQIWQIVALSLWLGVVNAVDVPTRQSFVIEMVERPEDLTGAIALNSSLVNAGRLAGPALGGLMTALFGVGACFLLNGFSFLAVILALLVMRTSPRSRQPGTKHVLQNLTEGLVYAFTFPPIRALLLIMALVSLAGMPYHSLLPAFTRHLLDGGPKGYGALVAAAGVGALSGALYLASRFSARGLLLSLIHI